jgi:2'-5' RNA ligase
MPAEASSRLFFALWPDDETRQNILHIQQAVTMTVFKPVPAQNFHVTLVFLGSVSKTLESTLKAHTTSIQSEPFNLVFDQLQFWPKARVLCLTSQQPHSLIVDLATAISNAASICGLKTDSRPYRPHVTLARHGQAFNRQSCPALTWRAQAFCLVESCSTFEGVRYQVLEKWNFAL